MERAEAEKAFAEAEAEYARVEAELGSAETPIKALQAAKRFGQLEDRLANMRCPDGLTDRRKNLRSLVGSKIAEAQQKALSATRI
jgi:hypothetical protein